MAAILCGPQCVNYVLHLFHQVCFNDDDQENIYKSSNLDNNDHIFYLKVFSNEKTWTIRRTYENFRLFDKQLHRCIYDRRVSCLPELRKNEIKEDNILVS